LEKLMILRNTDIRVTGPQSLWVRFNDGSEGEVDVGPLLAGPVFELLHDPAFFARAELDEVCGTVMWPNGADLAPEALRAAMGREVSAGQ
jgi:hypothetical protein